MKITERKLRKLIKETLERKQHEEIPYFGNLQERSLANVSDITRQRQLIEDWADVLLDELSEKLPHGEGIKDLKEKKRNSMIDGIRSAVTSYLIGALGTGLDTYSARRQRKEKDLETAKRVKQGRAGQY